MNLVYRHVDTTIGYYLAVAAMILLLVSGYFKDWKQGGFRFFNRKDLFANYKDMHMLIYFVSSILYFYGLQALMTVDLIMLTMMTALPLIAITLLQSAIILSGADKNKTFTAIWLVAQYLVLTWVLMWSFLDIELVSVIYSIAGLIVAIVSTYTGFRLKIKGIRLYGLVLTIIMVAKFIIIDMSQENSITRVLALIAGGILCFIITYIYNKLSEKMDEGVIEE